MVTVLVLWSMASIVAVAVMVSSGIVFTWAPIVAAEAASIAAIRTALLIVLILVVLSNRRVVPAPTAKPGPAISPCPCRRPPCRSRYAVSVVDTPGHTSAGRRRNARIARPGGHAN